MARLDELPAELVLHIISFLTREMIIQEPFRCSWPRKKVIVPDLSSVNALSRTNSIFHHTLNNTLYQLCASAESLGRLAILFAVEHNSEAAFDKLVAAGVRVDGEFYFKFWFMGSGLSSLLHIAAGMGRSLIVPKLLQIYGSETLKRVYARSDWHMSALDYAVLGGCMETVRIIAPMSILVASSSSLISVELSGEQIQAHKKYLGKALVTCVARDPSGEKIAICEYLLSEGADVDTLETYYMHSALYPATLADNLATMQLLLGAGADPNLRNTDGVVPLFRAGTVPTAQVLLNAGARIHATDNAGRNALTHRALYNPELARFLLERGVDPNQADNKGWTPLHYACWDAGVAAIEPLIQLGTTTAEKADRKGVTPVDLAMQRGKIEVVRFLEPLIQGPALKAKIAEWLKEKGGPEDTGQTI